VHSLRTSCHHLVQQLPQSALPEVSDRCPGTLDRGTPPPSTAQRIDRSGYTVIPGLVGMHNHLYYTDSYTLQVVDGRVGEPGLFIAEIPYTAPQLYLAAGVTTIRTTGSLEPYTDLKVKEPDRCEPDARTQH
jgi:hypothetical protein